MEKVLEHVSENLSVEIFPDDKFEFLITTNEAAKGFGINPSSLRSQKHDHRDELIEGKHFITSVGISNAGCNWTKRGIVRLGFFIKSERAKMFRDWAEDLVVNKIDEAYRVQSQVQQLSLFPEPVKRNHNRLTKERLVDILADVARIEDKELRLTLVDKLTNIKA